MYFTKKLLRGHEIERIHWDTKEGLEANQIVSINVSGTHNLALTALEQHK